MGDVIFWILFIIAIIVIAFMKHMKDRKGKWHGKSLKGEMTGYRYQWYEPSEEEEKVMRGIKPKK